jgi:ribosomal protein L24E
MNRRYEQPYQVLLKHPSLCTCCAVEIEAGDGAYFCPHDKRILCICCGRELLAELAQKENGNERRTRRRETE